MDLRFTIYYLVFCSSFLAGCAGPQSSARMPATPDGGQKTEDGGQTPAPSSVVRDPSSVLGLAGGFAPVKIGILPLTELSSPSGAGPGAKLSVFVVLLDAFGSQVKAPGVLRFELYEYVPRSAQPKGRQLALWPEIDLTGPAENHKYWRDFLRAYEFELDAQVGRDKPYVLEATCTCPMSPDKRLLAEYILKGSQ